MADLSNDLSYDLSLARFDELMNLRPTFARHKSILASIDHAIANVFDSFNHAEILVYTRRITELATMLPQLEAWGASIHLPFSQVYSTAIDVTYAKHATKMKSLMKLRDQMVGLGISTGGIEAGIAGIFKVIEFEY